MSDLGPRQDDPVAGVEFGRTRRPGGDLAILANYLANYLANLGADDGPAISKTEACELASVWSGSR